MQGRMERREREEEEKGRGWIEKKKRKSQE